MASAHDAIEHFDEYLRGAHIRNLAMRSSDIVTDPGGAPISIPRSHHGPVTAPRWNRANWPAAHNIWK